MAQQIARYGWIADIPDQRDHMFAAPLATLGPLPPAKDLTGQCPPVYDQGQIGSCTANAIAAAVEFLDILERFLASGIEALDFEGRFQNQMAVWGLDFRFNCGGPIASIDRGAPVVGRDTQTSRRLRLIRLLDTSRGQPCCYKVSAFLFDLFDVRKGYQRMLVAVASELHLEGQLGAFQEVVSFVASGIDADTNTLSRVEKLGPLGSSD